MEAFLYGHGVRMALPEDCVRAMMRLACDRTINGKETHLEKSEIAILIQGDRLRSFFDHRGRSGMQRGLSRC
jgi:hypothetical protein